MRVLILVLFCFFLACKKQPTEKEFHIGFSQCCDDAWRDVMNGEMSRELLLHPELTLDIRIANNDSEHQVDQIKELVASGIDILLVSPNETLPLTAVLEEIYKSGTPVLLIDREIESKLYTAYIGADNYEIGYTAGKYISSQFSEPAKALEIQLSMTISPARERSRGFRDAVSETPLVEIIGVLEAGEGLDAISENLPSLLDSLPETNVIFGHTDRYAEHAYRIAKGQGRANDMFFLGIDGIPGTGRGIQAVEDGILGASILYPTGGNEAIRLALAILNELPFNKENKLETIVIDNKNANILHNQMKKVSILQKNTDQQIDGLHSLELIYHNQRIYIIILLSGLLLSLILGGFLWKSLRAKQAAFQSLEAKNRKVIEKEKQLKQIPMKFEEATLESFHTHHSLSDLNIQLPDETAGLDRTFIQQFSAYVAANYTRQDFQVADLCQEMNLSRSQLYRKVKTLIGESIGSYVEKLRLKTAEQLLKESTTSVANIAYQVGYSSPDYFSTVFKSKYNMTPSQYRKKIIK